MNNIDLSALSMTELEALIIGARIEHDNRLAEKSNLINNFRTAFEALQQAGYSVYVVDYERIDDFNEFDIY